ncbi:MAG: ATP-binding cassette domain-containing protein [Eubacterium sp.]|nr:ATP-binding cassette domain-containing protein [Eubacterium sp.]
MVNENEIKAGENPAALIDCDGLVKIYKTEDLEVMALQGLDLTINKGELLAIIGKSGSGKSTLLNIIGGLERPSAGKITFDGISLSELTEKQMIEYREKRVGFVWQKSVENLLPYLTAVQNVEMPLMFSGLSKKKKHEKAMEMLRQVGMEHRADSYPRMLSGGEQQRVAIALSLIKDPDLILADEPTGAVDSKTSAMIQELFRKLNRERGVTVIIVTHDISLANRVDRVVMISDGKISSERVIKDAYRERIDALARRNAEDGSGSLFEEEAVEETHEEYVVLDRAGRLRLSPELREQAGIQGNRVKIEVVDGKVVITREDE